MDVRSVAIASASVYLLYKRYEPNNPLVHVALLLVPPALLIVPSYGHPNSSLAIVIPATYLFYWSLILALVVAYRLSPLHPLAKFPGPILARVSKWWMSYVTIRGNAHKTVRFLHHKYGDVVRIGPNELSFCRPDAMQPILGMKSLKKGPYYDTRPETDGMISLDGLRDFSEHAARRKPWNKAMSIAALKEYEASLAVKVRELVEGLGRRQDETVDLSAWMSFFGFDFMGLMTFGEDFCMLNGGKDTNGLVHTVDVGTLIAGTISHVPWIYRILMLLPGSGNEIAKMQQLGADCAIRRVCSGSSKKDLFYFLTEETEVNSPNMAALGARDGLLAIIAGSDTAATALSHICYFLLRNPECRTRLRRELNDAFQDEDSIDLTRLATLPYLNACINEALRLYPPVLGGLQRRVERGTGGIAISGCFVPEDTQVSLSVYAMHRDNREFSPIPDTYWPDRWLVQETYTLPTGETIDKDHVVTNRTSFLPFSYGPQNCAGRSLAIMELRMVTCALVRRFEIHVAKGFDIDSWERNIREIYVTNRGPLLVNVTAA